MSIQLAEPATRTRHLRRFVTGWVNDFTLAGWPLARFIDTITIDVDGQRTTITFDADPLPLPTAERSQRDLALAMLHDPFHPAWHAATETLLDVNGTWLHPNTRWEIDPYAHVHHRSALLIGCVDRDNPDAPRTYNPDLDPMDHDIGVIAFPLRPNITAEAVDRGCTPAVAGAVCALSCLVEGGIHEAFELYQAAPGVPHLDPHDPAAPHVTTTMSLHGGYHTQLYPTEGTT